jgi:hypothetical protein
MWGEGLTAWMAHHHTLCTVCDECGTCVEDDDTAVVVWQWYGAPYDEWVERILCEPCLIQTAYLARRWSGPWLSFSDRGTRPPWPVRLRKMLQR